jgi:hypothetical protein
MATLAFEIAELHDFGQQYGVRIGPWHYVRLVLGLLPYALILAAAALRAVYRESRGRSDWELTAHIGAHLAEHTAPPAITEEAA